MPHAVQVSAEYPLLLGSASPRRKEILGGLGVPLSLGPVDIDESVHSQEEPEAYLRRIAAAKMVAVEDAHSKLCHSARLVADTIVVVDDEILGKPKDLEDGCRLLRKIVGRTHRVFTRYVVRLAHSEEARARTIVTDVTMCSVDEATLVRYASTREGFDKAGGYAIQGLGAFLVQSIKGSYTNVVGLPAAEVVLDLRSLGVLPRFPL